MADIDPIAKPEDLHITGGETEQIGTKDLHITSEPADAIADKVLGTGTGASTNDLHITSEPAK
ncbi:hypothetical protein [Streptomyces sp. NPDC058664]|uniref:hypothetical protein n=1 Tax=unclassified Streptomyces TaxID=2593676 RepID=UPI003661341D